MRKEDRNKLRRQRHRKIRSKIKGTNKRPRVSIYKSLKHLYIQLIDDHKGQTLFGISDKSLSQKDQKLPKIKRAAILAKIIVQKARKLGIKRVVFDRSGYKYQGVIKEIADNLRQGGLKF